MHHLSRLFWYVTYYAKALGVWGLAGLGLMVFAFAYFQTHVIEVRAKTAELVTQKELLTTQQAVATSQQKAVITAPEIDEDIEQFYQRFPKVEELPKVLETILQLAQAQKIALKSGDYKLDKLKKNNVAPKTLTQYQISFPIKGGYQNIRRFTANVLEKLPGIAMLDMQIKRENATDPQVEANLVYVLFAKGQQW